MSGTGAFGDFEQVAEVGRVWEAELMALRLREAGIEAQVVDQTFRQEPLTSVRAFSVVRLLVPLHEVERARAVLAEARELPAEMADGDHEPDASG